LLFSASVTTVVGDHWDDSLQVSSLLDARALVEETLEMAGQDAVVAQHLFNVELFEPLHVGREIFDLFVGGSSSSGSTGRISLHGVHGHAAKSDQDFAVHYYGCCRER